MSKLLSLLVGMGLALFAGWAMTQPSLPPSVLVPVAYAGVIDAREGFKGVLCAVNERDGAGYPDARRCEDILSLMGAAPASPRIDAREACCYTLVFVPGILGECVAHLATPFSDSHERLRAKGHAVHVVPVKGRASSARNAAIIADYLAQREASLGKVIIVGYSKGVSDTLEALVAGAEAGWARKVKAVVSVAGVVSGTPIADKFAGLYDALLARLPWMTCPPDDGGGFEGITRSARLQFLASNRLPQHSKYYSLVALPRSGVNPLLLPFRAALAGHGPNDGQVVFHDAVIPGSYLLGYLNGDHWAVAVPFNRSGSIEAALLRIENAFPREVLIDSILQFVAGTLEPGQ
jgi:hypothetical protein